MRCSCCGSEVREDERFCSNCGQNNENYVENKPIEKVEIYQQQFNSSMNGQPQPIYQQTTQGSKSETGITIATKIFMIIGAVVMVISTSLIGLAWCIPMCIYYFNRVKNGQPIGTGFKVCSLLFVSLIGGILMLCDKDH